jgi:hypothetical protein
MRVSHVKYAKRTNSLLIYTLCGSAAMGIILLAVRLRSRLAEAAYFMA